MRVFALSDIHIDYPDNKAWIEGLSDVDYRRDVLILAGDVTHESARLEHILNVLCRKYAAVFYVPGNHELWTLKSRCADSLDKFNQIIDLCARLGVRTSPSKVGGANGVWIVPLFSWYTQPEEGTDSLFLPKKGEDPNLESWSDNYFVKWPRFPAGVTPSSYFLKLNEPHIQRTYDAPVITFSHFLPRVDLIFSTKEEDETDGIVVRDTHQSFNFSRVAGCKGLERQIRLLGSRVHIYGHQHRNRFRMVEGVLYVSQCLGYGHEREKGQIRYITKGPREVWNSETAFATVPAGDPVKELSSH